MNANTHDDRIHVRLEGVHRFFEEAGRRVNILENASAQIQSGEVVALLGRSGSGKSTVLNLVSGIDVPDAGVVEIGGRNINRISEKERTLFRRVELGFVFQSFNLVPTLTVGENIELPLTLARINSADRATRVQRALDDVELGDRARAFPENLSGGERQRVAVARALIHRPGLILADEPTGNLDDTSATGVLDLLTQMSRRHGATLIMATHSRGAAAVADRVLRIRDSKLKFDDVVQDGSAR